MYRDAMTRVTRTVGWGLFRNKLWGRHAPETRERFGWWDVTIGLVFTGYEHSRDIAVTYDKQ